MSKDTYTKIPGQAEWLSLIERKVNGIRFGSIQIVIHEGKVTQVEVTEKTRFAQSQARVGVSE
jgi:hypothetical protein